MKQFEVYDLDLDPTRGSEIKKRWPGVIISPDVMNRHLNTIIIAPLTRSIKGYPTRIASRFQRQSGEIALDQLRAVDKSRLIKKLGRVNKETSEGIKSVLKTMFS